MTTPIHPAPILLTALALLLTLGGCASIRPAVVAQTFGESSPERDQAIVEAAEATDEEDAPDVKVIAGRIPEGLSLEENGTKLVVLEGYEHRYHVLGTVEADYERGAEGAFAKNTFWTWSYEEDWRKGLCYWQVPFEILTLGIWSYAVPLHYPCFASIPGEESDRKIRLQNMIQRGAKAMGGNLAILVASQDLLVVNANRYQVSTDVIQTTALKAFVLKVSSD